MAKRLVAYDSGKRMIVVIDAYNLLRNISSHGKEISSKRRDQFIKEVAHYRKKKDLEIIVVFDRGPFLHATREVHGGVIVMFSGQKRTADEWIIDFMERHKGKDLILVSKDRDLNEECHAMGAEVIDPQAFYALVKGVLLEEVEQDLMKKERAPDVVEKYADDDDDLSEISSEALDLLMEGADVGEYAKEDVPANVRKSKSRVPKKNERSLRRKLKKL